MVARPLLRVTWRQKLEVRFGDKGLYVVRFTQKRHAWMGVADGGERSRMKGLAGPSLTGLGFTTARLGSRFMGPV